MSVEKRESLCKRQKLLQYYNSCLRKIRSSKKVTCLRYLPQIKLYEYHFMFWPFSRTFAGGGISDHCFILLVLIKL